MKRFIFSATEVNRGTVTVYAESEDEAREKVDCGDYSFDDNESEITDLELQSEDDAD